MLNRTPVGHLLREWRQRRRLSQLALACDAGISTRHLSFIETGRAQPSRDMVLHLSEQLEPFAPVDAPPESAVIVATPDAVLVSHRRATQDVKKIVDELERQQRHHHLRHP